MRTRLRSASSACRALAWIDLGLRALPQLLQLLLDAALLLLRVHRGLLAPHHLLLHAPLQLLSLPLGLRLGLRVRLRQLPLLLQRGLHLGQALPLLCPLLLGQPLWPRQREGENQRECECGPGARGARHRHSPRGQHDGGSGRQRSQPGAEGACTRQGHRAASAAGTVLTGPGRRLRHSPSSLRQAARQTGERAKQRLAGPEPHTTSPARARERGTRPQGASGTVVQTASAEGRTRLR